VKNTKPKAKDKEKSETNTPKNVYPIRSNLTYSRERLISPIHYQRVLTKRYKKVTKI